MASFNFSDVEVDAYTIKLVKELARVFLNIYLHSEGFIFSHAENS